MSFLKVSNLLKYFARSTTFSTYIPQIYSNMSVSKVFEVT